MRPGRLAASIASHLSLFFRPQPALAPSQRLAQLLHYLKRDEMTLVLDVFPEATLSAEIDWRAEVWKWQHRQPSLWDDALWLFQTRSGPEDAPRLMSAWFPDGSRTAVAEGEYDGE